MNSVWTEVRERGEGILKREFESPVNTSFSGEQNGIKRIHGEIAKS